MAMGTGSPIPRPFPGMKSQEVSDIREGISRIFCDALFASLYCKSNRIGASAAVSSAGEFVYWGGPEQAQLHPGVFNAHRGMLCQFLRTCVYLHYIHMEYNNIHIHMH